MACGSVYAKEALKVGRDLAHLDLSVAEVRSSGSVKHKGHAEQDSTSSRTKPVHGLNSRDRCCGGQEAVSFLQAEHEKILAGLHAEVRALQEKCGDLQFEVHLRNVSDPNNAKSSSQIQQLKASMQEKDAMIQELQTQLEEYEREHNEFRDHSSWRELQLKQQIEVGEQRLASLRDECLSLRAKVRDLKMYSAALRRGDSTSRPDSRASIIEDEPLSLDSGELSLSGTWRDARLSISQPKRTRQTSGSSIEKLHLNNSLSSSFDLSAISPSPSTARPSSSRPESVLLPPINLSQSVGKPNLRQQMRFSSAPAVNAKRTPSRRRASEAQTQKKKPAE